MTNPIKIIEEKLVEYGGLKDAAFCDTSAKEIAQAIYDAGWDILPREATDEMIRVGWVGYHPKDIYRAMAIAGSAGAKKS